MSMEHRAYIFDYCAFDRELRAVLVHALEAGDWSDVHRFVDTHRSSLANPYDGQPLEQDWRTAVASARPEVSGAVALTKYYDPVANIGLHAEWRDVFDALEQAAAGGGSIMLGDPIVGGGRVFDPGLLGTYLQEPLRIRTNLVALDRLAREHESLVPIVPPLAEMLVAAVDRGLYVRF